MPPSPYLNTVLNPTSVPSSPSPSSSPTPKRHPNPRSHSTTSTFTPPQQSLQARNKPFNSPPAPASESYELRKQRAEAAIILESVEMLLWFSAARNESISQTRKYYQDIVLGLSSPDSVIWREEYEIPIEQRSGSAAAAAAASSSSAHPTTGSPLRQKGKERVKKRG